MKSKLKEILKNNKGSTLVTVIIAISLVGILASLILVIVQNSYVTKSIDSQSKNNFYSAEEVVDQLKLGIQNEIAASMVDAYYDVISSFVYSENSTVREKKFREYVLKGHGTYGGFISKIKVDIADGRTNPVDVDKLNNLISEYYKSSVTDKYRLDVPKKTGVYIAYEYDTSNYEHIIIRNIGVEYYNSTGYVNGLFTDIRIDIPTPDFSLYDPTPNRAYEKYAIMARENVELVQNYNTADVNGSVWIGNDLRVSNSNSSIDINAENVLVKGEINVGPGTNGTSGRNAVNIRQNTNDKATLCAGNISLDSTNSSSSTTKSCALSLNADAYVKNDLVFEGDNSIANLKGTYHGIGSADDDPEHSSAIIVNGRNNELNATELGQLTLGGSSYIKAYQNNNYKVPNADQSILTGDSIAPRSNELSYLVPSEFMKGLPNPVTRADLSAAGYGGDFTQLTRDVNDMLNSSDIKSMLTGYEDPITHQTSYVRVLHYTYSSNTDTSTANNMSVAYYYLNFTSATSAKNFYKNKVNDGTKRMLLGLIPVKLEVKTNDDFRIVGVGLTKLTADNNGVVGDPDYTFDQGSGDMSFNEAFSTVFRNIKAFLTSEVPNIYKEKEENTTIPDEQKPSSKDAIDYIINWDLINADSGSGYILHEGQYQSGGTNALLTVKRNGITYPLRARIYKGASVTLNSTDLGGSYYGLIISTGNIYIQGNVDIHGLVIAGNVNTNNLGDIVIRNNNGNKATFTADPGAVRDIFNRAGLVHTTGGTLLSQILNGYVKTNNAGQDTELSTISMDNMFTYENWARN